MPLKRPVAGDPVLVEDFGQPVYDYIAANNPTAWTPVTYLNGWQNESGSIQGVQYRKIGDNVHVRGACRLGTAPAMCQLPVGYRPPIQLRYGMIAMNGTSGACFAARIDILIDGQLALLNYPDNSHIMMVNVIYSTVA